MQVNKQQKAPKAPQKPAAGAAERRIIRIADTDIDGSKKLRNALRLITGISFAYANAIIKSTGVSGDQKLQDIDEASMQKLKGVMGDPEKYKIPRWMYNWRRDEKTGTDKHILGNELKAKQTLHIQEIKTSRSYRGYRHSFNYKMRGQRVKSRGANFRGRVGTSMGVIKKAVAAQKANESK